MQVLSIKRRCQSTHLVQEHTDAPNVSFEVVCVALHDLWTQVVWSAYNCRSHLCRWLENSGYTEISKFHDAALHQEDILRFDISVQDLPVMAVFQSQTDLREPQKNLVFIEVIFCNFRFAFIARLKVLDFQSHVTT